MPYKVIMAILPSAFKALLGVLVSLLSWNAWKMCERTERQEQAIVALQITDAARLEKITQMQKSVDEIGKDVKLLLMRGSRYEHQGE